MEVKQPKIELVDIEKLIPYINNAKTHSDEQITALAGSIKEFGFLSPIIIDKDNGVAAGHGRLEASKKLGLKKVPCVIADHLTDAQKKAYVLADNRLAEYGSGWDKDLLKIELDDIRDNFNLDDIGFDAGFLSELDIDFSVEGEEEPPEFTPNIPEQNNEFKEETEFCLKITCNSDDERQDLFEELNIRGVKVKAI